MPRESSWTFLSAESCAWSQRLRKAAASQLENMRMQMPPTSATEASAGKAQVSGT